MVIKAMERESSYAYNDIVLKTSRCDLLIFDNSVAFVKINVY